MKFQLLSDVHLEFYKELPPIKEIITPQAPNLILAGDICFIKHPLFVPFFKKLSPMFKRIIYVLGNHEYYYHDDYRIDTLTTMELLVTDKLSPFKNIFILNKQYLELDEDVVILGCTLWSYLSKQDFVAGMKILPAVSFVKHSKTILLHPRITNKIHLMHKKWLYAMFEKFIDRKIIVVSHYVPSLKGLDAKYSFFNKAYYSNCDDLVQQADIWCCGHTHEQKIVHIGKTPLYINALGKPTERLKGPQNMIFMI